MHNAVIADSPSPLPVTASDTSRAVEAARSVAEAREQRSLNLGPDRLSSLVLGIGFIAVALVVGASAGIPDPSTALRMVLIAVLCAVTSKVVFESAGGDAVAAQPLLVAALFVLPLPYVPVTMLVGIILAWLISQPQLSVTNLAAEALAGWHTLGPVAVLAISGTTPASLAYWRWYLLALAAQFAVDGAVALVRCCALGIPTASMVRPLAWAYTVDCLLAPVGLTAVLATDQPVVALALACTPVVLLAMVARDRAAHLEQSLTISAAYDQALSLATTDALTDLANRRAWTEAVARAAIRHAAAPIDQPVTVLMADVDGLKHVNDSFGHDAGDELIRAASSVLRLAAPDGAIVARLGGDEFGILVTGRCDAEVLVDTVRLHAARHPTVRGCAVSLSIGTASCPPFDAVEDAVTEADLRIAVDKASRRIERRHTTSDHRPRVGNTAPTPQPAFPAIVHEAPSGLRN